MLFVWALSVGAIRPNPRAQRTFREKSFGIPKAFTKMKCCFGGKVFANFQGAFYKKPLEARSPHAVPTYNEKIKTRRNPRFLRASNVGAIRPKPRHKGLFGKSPLESQKLRPNKVMFLSKVLWHTFLRKKGVCLLFL